MELIAMSGLTATMCRRHAPFPWGGRAPDPVALRYAHGVLAAARQHGALAADQLGLLLASSPVATAVVLGKEEISW